MGGALTGANDTPELRKRLAGVNRTNTVVESVFALEKFLTTREKGSNLINRRGWTLFKYNKTWVWGERLTEGKLKLDKKVCRNEARKLRKAEGTTRQQLKRLFAFKATAREAKIAAVRQRKAAKQAEEARLRDPALRCTTFSGLKLLQNSQLMEQLKIRKLVDGRKESSGKPLICSPPAKGGRTWLRLKLQGLLKTEFQEKTLKKNPNDLSRGDLGCVESRAPRKKATPRAPAAPKGGKGGKGRGKRKAPKPEWNEVEDDEPEDGWPEGQSSAFSMPGQRQPRRSRSTRTGTT